MSQILRHHAQLLRDSGLTNEIIRERGYRTVDTQQELRQLGFRPQQCRVPSILIPVYGPTGELVNYQSRADEPRISGGHRVEYEQASQGGTLDVNPRIREEVGDPSVPLFIVDCVVKADAAVSNGLCCVAIPGFSNPHGWEHIVVRDRRVFVVLDSDVQRKPAMHGALRGLKVFLEGQGAGVALIYLPLDEDGRRQGLGRLLASGHTVDELVSRATTELQAAPEAMGAAANYEETGGGLIWHRPTNGGSVRTVLTNYTARIVADVEEDDGSGIPSRMFEIEASLKGRMRRFLISAREFGAMNWTYDRLGAEAYNSPGFGLKDHARVAIQALSGTIPTRTVYTHAGWRKINDRWCFLHAGGAIGADAVEVRLESGLERYRLPSPPDPETAREAVARSLRFLDIAARYQTWPALAAAYLAPLGEVVHCDFVLWLHGTTGARKSTAAALVASHFGEFARNTLPANFTSTGNALELQAYAAKDLVLVVDDYAPAPDVKSAAAQGNTAYRLLRAVGDNRGRNRATQDAKLRGEKAPRCFPFVTAEVPPPGSQSSSARTLEVEWLPETVNLDRLTTAQREDMAMYPSAMAGFIAWLAPQIDQLRRTLPQSIRNQAERMPGEHGRVKENAAKLMIGADALLRYAEQLGVISRAERDSLAQEAEAAISACALRTGGRQATRKPVVMFREYLTTLLAQGIGYVADRKTDGMPSSSPNRWGYTVRSTDGHGQGSYRARESADKLGWVDANDGFVYLLPAATYRAVTRYAQTSSEVFPLNQNDLGEYLDRAGWLGRKSKGHRTYRVRVGQDAENGVFVWAVPISVLFPDGEDGANTANSANGDEVV